MPKLGINLLLISYLLLESFVLASDSLFPYFLLLYSESLRSLLPFQFLIFYHSSFLTFYRAYSFAANHLSLAIAIVINHAS